LQFLMTREITHMKAFTLALESLGKKPFSIGKIEPTPGLVDEYFNDSTGEGDEGETDATGAWNSGGQWKVVEPRELQLGVENLESSAGRKRGREQEKLKKTA
ncbi:MAG: manganese catalase family protein, partial [Candidatus Sulfotelmatobacter sp.]